MGRVGIRTRVQTVRPHRPVRITTYSCAAFATCLALVVTGCGNTPTLPARPAPLFSIPVSVNDEPVGRAVIDTGGGYDLMLADGLGLEIVETVEILVFHGIVTAGVTESFRYAAGGFETTADRALVGVDLCDCNGLGFFFLRKTGAVLGIDFARGEATLTTSPPTDGVYMPFAAPPPQMSNFDTSFMEVELSDGDGATVTVTALVDTGSNTTLMRRGIVGPAEVSDGSRVEVFISRPELGTVAARIGVFDTPGLPDLLIGTDVMRAWSNEWHFLYRSEGGFIRAVPRSLPDQDEIDAADSPAAKRLPYRIHRMSNSE